jgi:hypothetical protein
VEWRMIVEIGGQQLLIPCSRKALKFSDNQSDEPILNKDLIDEQMEKE